MDRTLARTAGGRDIDLVWLSREGEDWQVEAQCLGCNKRESDLTHSEKSAVGYVFGWAKKHARNCHKR
ncbi:hypothetical protein [Streptomyces buecherae]|uniref:hypothetical protein n=1 Tax=Streptomyces buecherae TaxID=2763006 RepID=UPI003656FF3D